MAYSPWTLAPNGQSASLAILNDWIPKGTPMTVTHRTNPINIQETAIANPPKTIHRILPMIRIAGSLRSIVSRKMPDGISDLHSMVLV